MSNEKQPPTRVSHAASSWARPPTAAGITIVPRHVLGAGFQAPSDTVNVAVVGYAHGMGTNNLLNVAKTRQHRRAVRLRRERGGQGGAGAAAARRRTKFPKAVRVQGLPRDAREAEGHRRGARRHARSQPRRDRDGRDAARQARLRAEAADAHHHRGARADRSGAEVQGRDADGQPGPLRRGPAPDAGVVRRPARSARCARCTAGPTGRSGRRACRGRPTTQPVPGRHRLGSVDRPGADAPVPQDLPPVRLARVAGLRRRRDGRHGAVTSWTRRSRS